MLMPYDIGHDLTAFVTNCTTYQVAYYAPAEGIHIKRPRRHNRCSARATICMNRYRLLRNPRFKVQMPVVDCSVIVDGVSMTSLAENSQEQRVRC